MVFYALTLNISSLPRFRSSSATGPRVPRLVSPFHFEVSFSLCPVSEPRSVIWISDPFTCYLWVRFLFAAIRV